MDEANREKIRKLANLTKEEIGNSEEDVKINFIVPLFEAFGHERLKFEHRWKDALVEEIDPLCKLIIETKNYDKDLNKELQQLERYCNEERPLLGIIANGREMRIFSHFWRYRPTFPKTLIYCINRKDLNNENVIQKIENILSITNLKNGKAKDFIMKKEREIENEEDEIESVEKDLKEKVEQLQVKIDDLSNKIEDIEKQVEKYKSEKKKIIKETREQILQIWQNLGFPQIPVVLPPTYGFHKSSEKPGELDSKRYNQLEHYIFPAIHLIKQGIKHSDAFHIIEKKLNVTYSTVNAECTRQLGVRIDEFVDSVNNNKIIQILIRKHPDKIERIKHELERYNI
ncbi:hypothetical protein E3V08_06455 [Candidatus Atribacteria bacterium MT.SAG.1]|nr:hypothetical protein E3V08_06455 [Candidatus Atribacteria bacterium MT.SAG.1]